MNFHLWFLQVVQVLRAIDRDQGGQDALVHFSIPPESSSALNLSIRESGGWKHWPYFYFPCKTQKTDTSQKWCMFVVQWPCMMCVCFVFFIFFCHFIRCDSQPGAADSLRAPAWLLLIFTHPLRASRAARRGLGSNQHWHSHRDYLSLFAGGHADWGQGQTEGQEMGETHGLSSRAVRLSVSYIQFGDITGHAGLCHNSSGYGWSVLWSLWTTLNIVCCLSLFLKTLSSCVRLLL